jgi:D-alanyl-D-alanine carboxypeptidase
MEYSINYISKIVFFMLLLLGFIRCLEGVATYFSLKTEKKIEIEHIEPSCEMVEGEGHIYRGQCLYEEYKPDILLPLSPRASYLDSRQYLDIRAKMMVEQMIMDAEKEKMCLVVVSGYRSFEDQQILYNKTEDKSKVAVAGQSEHQTGLAVDFSACPMNSRVRDDSVERTELANDFDTLAEYKWLQKNAFRYGFVQSYTNENKEDTGYPAESWHWKLIVD